MDDVEQIKERRSVKTAPVQTLGELAELVAQSIEWGRPRPRLGGCTRYALPDRDIAVADLMG